jgi:signal transduction histidine kinase
MNRLWFRLAVSGVLVTWLVIAFIAGLMSYAVESNFGNFLNTSNSLRFGSSFVAEIEAYYATYHTWEGIDVVIPPQSRGGGGAGDRQGFSDGQGAHIFVADADGIIIYATDADWLGMRIYDVGANRAIELSHDGQRIGFLGEQTPGTVALNTAEAQFLQETINGLIVTAFGGSVLAFVVGTFTARSLTRPLQQLAQQVNQINPSDIGQSIHAGGTMEIEQLGTAFNDLSKRLGDEKQQRQRMTADIAHELRTPVTVMRGHVEAMMDGVYPLDVQHLAVAYDQTLHLTRLIEDMRLLTKVEAGQLALDKVMIAPQELLALAVQRFQPLTDDAEITVHIEMAGDMPPIAVDVSRIQQAFDNLMNNAIRHTPPKGTIMLAGESTREHVILRVHNTGDPIPSNVIHHVFDRFWRADSARERDAGGTGLGLAITRQLIELHGGDIRAIPTADGATFEIVLPMATNAKNT